MKIKSLQISNLLSFKFYPRIEDAQHIIFDNNLNIIIGENGAGKSTALEVINFLFKRVFFIQYNVNQDNYTNKQNINFEAKKQIVNPINNNNYGSFRLTPNWNTEADPQKIRIEIELDSIDIENIAHLSSCFDKIHAIGSIYSQANVLKPSTYSNEYIFDVSLEKTNNTFYTTFIKGADDFGYQYLVNYNFYKELINLYNLDNPKANLRQLHESFSIISSYRNYNQFNTSVSLQGQHASQQIQQLRNNDFSKSLNSNESAEPGIFSFVRLRVAEKHFSLITEKLSATECEKEANDLPFIKLINEKLKIVNIECRIRLLDIRTWQYSFEFTDLRRNKILNDINSLSAGQKAIVHLVFEAYGRGELKGGVVIIDEPEIHLHYQFQNEYLQVIEKLNAEQNCQYILVTHSEALINSSTITHVKRFSLNSSGFTEIKAPTLTTDQKTLIRILDNTKSTYAFFAKKVILVEGDTDRYFIKAVLQLLNKNLDQEIAILYMGGKNNWNNWSKLFKDFGLSVYGIFDLDFLTNLHYPSERGTSLKTSSAVSGFKSRNANWQVKLEEEYTNGIFILKNGDLEHYLSIPKDLLSVINFCNSSLDTYLRSTGNAESTEIQFIINSIAR